MDNIDCILANEFKSLTFSEKVPESEKPSKEVSAELKESCWVFMRLSQYRKKSAEKIYALIIKEHIMASNKKYYKIDLLKSDEFKELRDDLHRVFCMLLDTNIKSSIYGEGLISDFDLKFNFNKKDADNFGFNSAQVELLLKQKINLSRFIKRLVNGVINEFPLEEKPEKEQVTPDVAQALEKASRSSKKAFSDKKSDGQGDMLAELVEQSKGQVDEEVESVPRKLEFETDTDVVSAVTESIGDERSKEDSKKNGVGHKATNMKKRNQGTNQYYGTTDVLLNLLWNNIEFNVGTERLVIIDPMCGKGNILEYFRNKATFKDLKGFDKYYSHLFLDTDGELTLLLRDDETDYKYDFLEYNFEPNINNFREDDSIPIIITNPPFSGVNEFVDKLVAINLPFITLLPIYSIDYKSVKNVLNSRDNSFIISCGSSAKFETEDGIKNIPFGVCWLVVNTKDGVVFRAKREARKVIYIPFDEQLEEDIDSNEEIDADSISIINSKI